MNNLDCNCKRDCCDPCKKDCCEPARFSSDFSIKPDSNDPRYWWVCLNGLTKRIRVPNMAETGTFLDLDCTTKTLTYYGEKEKQVFTGKQLGCLLELDDISNVNAANPDPCSLLVFNPGCGGCPCDPEEDTWQAYKIPEAGDCVIEPDEDGYYHVLVMNDCGCPVECRLPVVAPEAAVISYERDSVPDDPDFPWYYGIYNDTINLHLEDNAPKYFGAYALEVTVFYGIQVVHPSVAANTNFRSIIVPKIEGETDANIRKLGSILQDDSTTSHGTLSIPWGTKSMRGSFSFIVPKGKEAALYHEFRLISQSGLSQNPMVYHKNATYDGKKVPDNIAGQLDKMPWPASRLNQLEVVVKPVSGVVNLTPVVDEEREELDPAEDLYPGFINV